MEDPKVSKIFETDRADIINFVEETLMKDNVLRDDYKEFLKLTLIFLGKSDPSSVHFYPPGAIHHARWMAKAIYCLKIYLFRDQFTFQKGERENIKKICIFIVKLYVQAWFTAPNTIKAPNHDLQFIKKLFKFSEIDKAISRDAIAKLENHLWYLSPESTALAFFDKNVSVETKKEMVAALEEEGDSDEIVKKVRFVNIQEINSKELKDFVDCRTRKFFDRFKLSVDFLKLDPSTWQENEKYKENLEIVRKLKSVNDVAERGVKLIEEYNEKLTKDEKERQRIIQIVADHRQQFPDVKKETLKKPLA